MSASGPIADAFRASCGAAFEHLPEIVRRAHSGRSRLAGQVRVRRGNRLSRLIADAMGLPKAGERVDMLVDSEHRPDCMLWNRSFGGRQFRSCFRLDAGGLTESVGPFRLHLRLVVADGRLLYRLERISLWRLPWPRWLAPALEAWEGAAGAQYEFAVEVRLPLLGRLVRYEGKLDHLA